MAEGNRILQRMLDRLFASMVNGPSLNARPHSSRQRVDITHLGRLKDISADELFRRLLGEECGSKLRAKVPQPPKRVDDHGSERSEEDKKRQQAWTEQQAVL